MSPSSALAAPPSTMDGLTFAMVTSISSEPMLLVVSPSSAVTLTGLRPGRRESQSKSMRLGVSMRVALAPSLGHQRGVGAGFGDGVGVGLGLALVGGVVSGQGHQRRDVGDGDLERLEIVGAPTLPGSSRTKMVTG